MVESATGEPKAPQHPDGDLDQRKWRILKAIIAEYVASAEPVGSKRVVETARLDVSPATVRNEMAALEEAGYIVQPHTSAGRVPTDKGYRYFVDELQHHEAFDERHQLLVQDLLGPAHDTEEVLRRATQVLAQVTHLVSLVIAPTVDQARLKLLELVSLTPQAVLVLLVTDTGRVEKRLVELRAPMTETDVERASHVLNETVRGRRVRQLDQAVAELPEQAPPELRDLMRAAVDAVSELEQPVVERIFVGGAASLAGESGIERADLSRVLELLEERVTLARILAESTTADEPLVRIGEEHDIEGLQTTSLIAQRYRLVSAGSLGILGPTRMDYAAVLSAVKAVADQLQATLHHLDEV